MSNLLFGGLLLICSCISNVKVFIVVSVMQLISFMYLYPEFFCAVLLALFLGKQWRQISMSDVGDKQLILT